MFDFEGNGMLEAALNDEQAAQLERHRATYAAMGLDATMLQGKALEAEIRSPRLPVLVNSTNQLYPPDPAAKWNCALDVQAKEFATDISVDRQPMPAKWDWPLASPLKLRASAVAIDWSPDPKAPRLPGCTDREGRAGRALDHVAGCLAFRGCRARLAGSEFRIGRRHT
jgi:hypothetical protein